MYEIHKKLWIIVNSIFTKDTSKLLKQFSENNFRIQETRDKK